MSRLDLTFGLCDKFSAFAKAIQPWKPGRCRRVASGWSRIVVERFYAWRSRTSRLASTSLLETYQSSAHRHALEPAKPLCQLVELNLSFTHLGSADVLLALQSALRRGALPALRRIEIRCRRLAIGTRPSPSDSTCCLEVGVPECLYRPTRHNTRTLRRSLVVGACCLRRAGVAVSAHAAIALDALGKGASFATARCVARALYQKSADRWRTSRRGVSTNARHH